MAVDLCAASAVFAFVLIGAVNALVRADPSIRSLPTSPLRTECRTVAGRLPARPATAACPHEGMWRPWQKPFWFFLP